MLTVTQMVQVPVILGYNWLPICECILLLYNNIFSQLQLFNCLPSLLRYGSTDWSIPIDLFDALVSQSLLIIDQSPVHDFRSTQNWALTDRLDLPYPYV